MTGELDNVLEPRGSDHRPQPSLRVCPRAFPAVRETHGLESCSTKEILRSIEIRDIELTPRCEHPENLSKGISLSEIVKMMEDEARHDPVKASVLIWNSSPIVDIKPDVCSVRLGFPARLGKDRLIYIQPSYEGAGVPPFDENRQGRSAAAKIKHPLRIRPPLRSHKCRQAVHGLQAKTGRGMLPRAEGVMWIKDNRPLLRRTRS